MSKNKGCQKCDISLDLPRRQMIPARADFTFSKSMMLVRLEHNVELETLVFGPVDELFRLGLAPDDELRVLGPAREAHPRVVEHAAAQVALTRAH